MDAPLGYFPLERLPLELFPIDLLFVERYLCYEFVSAVEMQDCFGKKSGPIPYCHEGGESEEDISMTYLANVMLNCRWHFDVKYVKYFLLSQDSTQIGANQPRAAVYNRWAPERSRRIRWSPPRLLRWRRLKGWWLIAILCCLWNPWLKLSNFNNVLQSFFIFNVFCTLSDSAVGPQFWKSLCATFCSKGYRSENMRLDDLN